jgi:predicted DNA-binding transcriptional regulator AlpA
MVRYNSARERASLRKGRYFNLWTNSRLASFNSASLKNWRLRNDEPIVDVSFLHLPEVKAIPGRSETRLFGLVREKSFPASVRLGPQAVALVKAEIRAWCLDAS